MSSPTQRSLAYLRDQGWRCAVTEHWNPFANIRQDLFGIIDILCLRNGQVLAVQTTSYDNVSARVRKIADSDAIADIRKCGWSVHVHGWHKVGNRWVVRDVDVS